MFYTKLTLILLVTTFLTACWNVPENYKKEKSGQKLDSLTIPSFVSGKDTVRVDCGLNESMSTTQVFNSKLISVEYRIVCSDKVISSYKYNDTIYGIRDQLIDVGIKVGSDTRNIKIYCSDFKAHFGKNEIDSWVMGTTRMQPDFKNNQVIFKTFIGEPMSDSGVTIEYSISLEGKVTFIRVVPEEEQEQSEKRRRKLFDSLLVPNGK